MEKYDIVVFGNCATVQVLKFNKMPMVGQTDTALNVKADEIFYGGCAFNTFYGLAKLGLAVYPALTYADIRFKEKIYKICMEHCLPTEGIEGPPTASYSTCLMLQDDNKNHITLMYHFGEDSDKELVEARAHTVKQEYFESCKMVLMVMGMPANGFKIIEQIKANKVPLAFSYRNDPLLLPENLLAAILPQTSVLFTNEDEAKYLTELFGLCHITDWFVKGKAQVIVTTMGSKGCVVYSKAANGEVESICVPVTKTELGCVDTIGAGDGFVAGFLYGYIRGKSMKACAQYGNTVSSFVIEKDGSTTNLPTSTQLLGRNARRSDAVEE